MVKPADQRIRMRRSAKRRQLHDMSDPCFARRRNGMVLQCRRVLTVAREQEQCRAARERRGQSLGLREISNHRSDSRQLRLRAPAPDERASGHAGLREQPDDLAPDQTGASGNENHFVRVVILARVTTRPTPSSSPSTPRSAY